MINVYIEIWDIRPCFEAFGVLSFRASVVARNNLGGEGGLGWPLNPIPKSSQVPWFPVTSISLWLWTNYTLTYPNIMNSTEFDPGWATFSSLLKWPALHVTLIHSMFGGVFSMSIAFLQEAVQVVGLTLKQLLPSEPSLRHDTNIRHGCRALILAAKNQEPWFDSEEASRKTGQKRSGHIGEKPGRVLVRSSCLWLVVIYWCPKSSQKAASWWYKSHPKSTEFSYKQTIFSTSWAKTLQD